MSGLFGKAARFAKSKQGKETLAKVQKYAKSDEGKQRIESLKDKVEDFRGGGKDDTPEAKPAPAPVVDTSEAPKPDPAAPEPPPAA